MNAQFPRQPAAKAGHTSPSLFVPRWSLWLFLLLLTACGSAPMSGQTMTPTPGLTVTFSSGEGDLLLTQQNPVCDPSSTTVWKGGSQSTKASSCRAGTLALSPVSQTQLAEIDLVQINGRDYSDGLTDFEVSVDLTQAIAVSLGLQETHSDIWVGLNVQTPAPGYGCGGMIFEVSPLGYWNLEQVKACDQISVLDTGTFLAPEPSPCNCDSQRVTMHLKVTVQNGRLTGWAEGRSLVSVPDPFVPSPTKPSVVGLVAQYRTNTSLSPTMFTHFRLATGKCRQADTHCSPLQ